MDPYTGTYGTLGTPQIDGFGKLGSTIGIGYQLERERWDEPADSRSLFYYASPGSYSYDHGDQDALRGPNPTFVTRPYP